MLIAERYANQIDHHVINRGKVSAASHFKAMHLFCRNIALGITLPAPLPFVRTDKKGIPKVIKPLVPLLTGSPDDKRIGLTISRFYESIYVKPAPNLDAITAPNTEDQLFNIANEIEDFKSFVEQKITVIARNPGTPNKFKVINRLVSGPNGPAMLTAHYDALALAKTDLAQRLNSLTKIFPQWGFFEE